MATILPSKFSKAMFVKGDSRGGTEASDQAFTLRGGGDWNYCNGGLNGSKYNLNILRF